MDDDCRRDGGWSGCEMHDLGDGDYGKCDYTGRQQECPHSLILKRCGERGGLRRGRKKAGGQMNRNDSATGAASAL